MSNLVSKALKVAENSLRNFFKNIDLDDSLFEHLFKIPVIIRYIEDDNAAYSNDDTACIILNKSFIQELEEVNTNEKMEKSIVNTIAFNIVHEMLHANRTVLMGNSLEKIYYEEELNNQLSDKIQELYTSDLDHYKKNLDSIIQHKIISVGGKTVILGVINDEINGKRVILYNNESKSFYEMYSNGTIISVNEDLLHKDSSAISHVSCDYYHGQNFKLKDLKEKNITKNKMKKEYKKEHNEKVRHIGKVLDAQYELEEAITNSVADIIIKTRNDSELDLGKTADFLIKRVEDKKEAVILEIIKRKGIDFIKWFMLSSYDDCYYDLTYKMFGDKYEDFLNMYLFSEEEFREEDAKRIIKNKI